MTNSGAEIHSQSMLQRPASLHNHSKAHTLPQHHLLPLSESCFFSSTISTPGLKINPLSPSCSQTLYLYLYLTLRKMCIPLLSFKQLDASAWEYFNPLWVIPLNLRYSLRYWLPCSVCRWVGQGQKVQGWAILLLRVAASANLDPFHLA